MKLFLSAGLMGLLAVVAQAGTASSYINYGSVTTPPVIDATNFINYGTFSFSTTSPFDFSNVRNYTNRNYMANFGSGFRFDTAPSTNGSRHPAVNFYNAPLANNSVTNASIYAAYQLAVSATNIVNRGMLSVGEYGLISLDGRNVDVSRGAFSVGTFSDRGSVTPEAIFDSAWGFGTSSLLPNTAIVSAGPRTPVYDYTRFIPQVPYVASRNSLFPFFAPSEEITNYQMIREEFTNRTVQIVFLRNNNTNIQTRVRFAPNPTPALAGYALGAVMIEWSAVGTNAFGQIVTNLLYLTDTYGINATNDFIVHYPFSSQPPQSVPIPPSTSQPNNYSITRSSPTNFFFEFADEGEPFVDPTPDFWTTNARPERVNASYSAYDARLATTTIDPSANNYLQITNLRSGPGRVEMKASGKLDLNLARIDGLNYLSLQATNHFAGASNASIFSTYADINLASTNGQLNTSGLLKSSLPRFNGTISCYSAKWGNIVIHDTEGGGGPVTNTVNFHVLFVDSQLLAFATPQVFNLSLKSTNVLLGDSFTVFDNLNLNTESLTVLDTGIIDVQRPDIVWQNSAPRLNSLVNYGTINFLLALNDMNFAGRKSDGTDRPYATFENYGTISGAAVRIMATNVVNAGLIESLYGPILIESAGNVSLVDGGQLWAPYADVSISCRNLIITNQFFSPFSLGRSLSLSVTDSLTVGPTEFDVYDGFHLLAKPAVGDLSEVSLLDFGFAYSEVMHTWAGLDLGPTVAGFTNNAALGSLTLSGDIETLFTFAGTGPGNNALYVDVLILDGTAGNLDPDGNLIALNLLPGMKIYFSQAILSDGTDMTAALAGKNGGALVNVPHTGPLSLPAPAPSVALKVNIQPTPTPRALISWDAVPHATNWLYYLSGTGASNWQLLTNFVSGSETGTETVIDSNLQNSRFYKLKVNVPSH